MRSLCPNSYWHETATAGAAQFASLGRDARADVAVIGAGITGLTAALHLKRAGRRVVVLEAGRIGDGTTGGTTAHLDALPDQGMRQFIKDFGEDAARTVTQGRLAAIDHLEAWCRDFGIACDFARIPAYAYTEEPDHVASLEAECDACRKMGMQVGMTTDIPLPFACAGGFRIERQGRFHALDYLRGLAAQVEGEGCTIHEMTRAFPPESGTPCTIPTEHGQVKAEQVLAATHSAFFGISQLDMRVAPYQSYVMAARVQQSIPDALYWDDAEPYRYTRRARSDDPNLLIVGGADHKTGHGDPQEHYGLLEEYIRRRYIVQAIEQRWSAEYFEPSDGQPYVGAMALAPHLYAATGFSGTGMTYGTMAGQLVADLILGRTNSLASIWSPTRIKPLASAHDFLAENFDIAKRFIGDRLRRERIPSLEAIGPGEGRLVAIDGKQVAVYRDRQGLVHAMSPTCTHAGCVVQWNNAERTWDCPCHGGRYSATGERIYGPPSQDLHRTQVE